MIPHGNEAELLGMVWLMLCGVLALCAMAWGLLIIAYNLMRIADHMEGGEDD